MRIREGRVPRAAAAAAARRVGRRDAARSAARGIAGIRSPRGSMRLTGCRTGQRAITSRRMWSSCRVWSECTRQAETLLVAEPTVAVAATTLRAEKKSHPHPHRGAAASIPQLSQTSPQGKPRRNSHRGTLSADDGYARCAWQHVIGTCGL